MGTKYSTNSTSGYNATPPSDDGTVSESNKVKWSTIKTKLTDPLDTLASTINDELVTHFNNGPNAYTSNQTLGAGNYNTINQVSGSGVTLTLTDASTLTSGWHCEIVNTDTANSVTLARATASDMINETSANVTILPLEHLRVVVNAAANGFLVTTQGRHTKAYSVLDSVFTVADPADTTKKTRIDSGSITTGTTRVLTMGDADFTLAAATQAEQEAGSSTTVIVTPGRQHFHPSAAKAWVKFNGTGTVAINASYNVTSITDNGTGNYTINFTTSMSSVHYAVVGSFAGADSTGQAYQGPSFYSFATGSVIMETASNTATVQDGAICSAVIFGDI